MCVHAYTCYVHVYDMLTPHVHDLRLMIMIRWCFNLRICGGGRGAMIWSLGVDEHEVGQLQINSMHTKIVHMCATHAVNETSDVRYT